MLTLITKITQGALVLSGSHNDINVLQRSLVFASLVEGNYPSMNVNINGHNYNKGYLSSVDYFCEDNLQPRRREEEEICTRAREC